MYIYIRILFVHIYSFRFLKSFSFSFSFSRSFVFFLVVVFCCLSFCLSLHFPLMTVLPTNCISFQYVQAQPPVPIGSSAGFFCIENVLFADTRSDSRRASSAAYTDPILASPRKTPTPVKKKTTNETTLPTVSSEVSRGHLTVVLRPSPVSGSAPPPLGSARSRQRIYADTRVLQFDDVIPPAFVQ